MAPVTFTWRIWDNHRIPKFSPTGSFLTALGSSGSAGNGLFNFPAGVALDGAGNLYVADTDNHCIQKLSATVRFPHRRAVVARQTGSLLVLAVWRWMAREASMWRIPVITAFRN